MFRRILVALMKTGIVLGCAFIGTVALLRCCPPLGGAWWWLASPSPKECNMAEAVRSVGYLGRYDAAETRIASSARMIQRDGDLQLWDIPGARQFWIYQDFQRRNATTFAEQVADQYGHPDVHVQPGDIVLDVGADFGSVTWRALQSGAQKVVAIEIAPQKWECLKRTFAKEIAEGRVVVVPLGVWDQDGTLELGDDSVVMDRGKTKQTVRVTTIDHLVADLHLPRVDFITMDIEGAEKPALRGAAETLRRFHPRMAIAAEHLPDDAVAIPKTVTGMVSNYRTICGRCELRDRRLVANVLWFR